MAQEHCRRGLRLSGPRRLRRLVKSTEPDPEEMPETKTDTPRMAPRNNEIRGRWPSRSRIDDDDDVRQTRYWVGGGVKGFLEWPYSCHLEGENR